MAAVMSTHRLAALRSELAMLKARYDSGAVAQGVYAVIREIESAIAWGGA
jgi:hypothetical protein